MHDFKILIWAAMHSPDFNLCRIQVQRPVNCRITGEYLHNNRERVWEIEISLQEILSVYVPWSVKNACCRSAYKPADSALVDVDYDEIPF